MSDDAEAPVDVPHDGETLLYDYFKHLTSLCLFSLGGVLALAQNAKGVSAGLMIAVLGVIGVAALISFSGTAEIVAARFHRKPLGKHVNHYRAIAPVFLSVGVGMFLYLFTRTLNL